MASIVIDFSEIPEDVLPEEGEHRVEIVSIELRNSKSGPHPYLNWEMTILGDSEAAGSKLWMMTSLAPKALFRLRAVLKAFDIEFEKASFEVDDASKQLLDPDLVGRIAIAKVYHEEYQGRKQARVSDLIAADVFDENGEEADAPLKLV